MASKMQKSTAAPRKRATSTASTSGGMSLSPYQRAFVDWLVYGSGHGVLIAVAGAGKTTTLLAGANAIDSQHNGYAVVFNRRNADELRERFPQHVRCGTFHSLWMQACRAQIGNNVAVDERKTQKMILRVLPTKTIPARNAFEEPRVFVEWALKPYVGPIKQLVAYAKNAGAGILCPNTDDTYKALIEHYGMDIDLDESVDVDTLCSFARNVLDVSNQVEEHRMIDFDDMLYLPVLRGWSIERRDFVFVDEAQDTNAVQVELVRKMLAPDGRAVFVGDPHQAIYGFRGARNDALSVITRDFRAHEMPLTVSYRCPQAVVARARKYVSHIEAHDKAIKGNVEMCTSIPSYALTNTAAIVCRTTAPLVSLAFRLIRAKIGCKILGRDIGERLRELAQKMNTQQLEQLAERLEAWRVQQLERAARKDDAALAQMVEDKVSSLLTIIESLPVGSSTDELLDRIDKLFTNTAGGVLTLCTVHKAKGLEWNTVTIIRPDLMPLPWVKLKWQKQQETNIAYVATTRAKQNLIIVNSAEPAIDPSE